MSAQTDFSQASNQPKTYKVLQVNYFADGDVKELAGEPVIAFMQNTSSDSSKPYVPSDPYNNVVHTKFRSGNAFIDYVPESQLAIYAAEIEGSGYPSAYEHLKELVKQVKELPSPKTLFSKLSISYKPVTADDRKSISNRLADDIIASVSGPSFFKVPRR